MTTAMEPPQTRSSEMMLPEAITPLWMAKSACHSENGLTPV